MCLVPYPRILQRERGVDQTYWKIYFFLISVFYWLLHVWPPSPKEHTLLIISYLNVRNKKFFKYLNLFKFPIKTVALYKKYNSN